MHHNDTSSGPSAPTVSGETFSELINLSGRRRFTSQRVVLFAVLAAQGRAGALAASKEALATFRHAHQLLVKGDERLPGVFCEELTNAYFGAGGGDAAIDAFAALAARTHDAIDAGLRSAQALLDELVDQATTLLVVLNGLTQVYEDLSRRHASQARRQLNSMMGDIQTIAKEARIVSFNAQLVAARSPGGGREFAVVAGELSHITRRMDDLVREALQASR